MNCRYKLPAGLRKCVRRTAPAQLAASTNCVRTPTPDYVHGHCPSTAGGICTCDAITRVGAACAPEHAWPVVRSKEADVPGREAQ